MPTFLSKRAGRPAFASWTLVAAASFVACGSGGEEIGDTSLGSVGSTSQAVIKGENSDESQNAVVLLAHIDGRTADSCTGTLIAPNLVLTARHCVSLSGEGAFACNMDGTLVGTRGTGGQFLADFQPADIYVFAGTERPQLSKAGVATAAGRGSKVLHDGSKVVCGHDIALVVLEKAVEGVTPAKIRLSSGPVPNENLLVVGWGLMENGTLPPVRKQRNNVPVLRVGPFEGNQNEAPVPANDFTIGEAICEGDSGGPAFNSSTLAVVGVVSRGSNGTVPTNNAASSCIGADTVNAYTQLEPFNELILAAFKEAGSEPHLEDGVDPTLAKAGAACTAAAQCQSLSCSAAGDAGGGTCDRVCSETEPCATGQTCTPGGTFAVCKADAATTPTDLPEGKGCSCAVPGHEGDVKAGSALACLLVLGALSSMRRGRAVARARAVVRVRDSRRSR
ncbi:MAG: trypsin-like serine protease [Polyangiaceae bacterium]